MNITMSLDRLSPVPLYHQLGDQLKGAIAAGELPKGEFLENEIALAERWNVSRPTVRRAIQSLVDDGLLVRRRGVGTQVVNAEVRRPFTLTSLHDDLVAGGAEPTTEVISIDTVNARDDDAEALGVRAGSRVVEIVRVRSTGTRPLALMRNVLIEEVAGDLTAESLTDGGLYHQLRARGVRPHYAEQRLGARAADAAAARLLDIEVGAPLVTMRRVMQDDTGRKVEIGDHAYDAAYYSIEMSVVTNPN